MRCVCYSRTRFEKTRAWAAEAEAAITDHCPDGDIDRRYVVFSFCAAEPFGITPTRDDKEKWNSMNAPTTAIIARRELFCWRDVEELGDLQRLQRGAVHTVSC